MLQLDADMYYIITGAMMVLAGLLGFKWQIVKSKLSEIRQLVDAVDDALYDDSVSEDEFRDIFRKFETIVKKS